MINTQTLVSNFTSREWAHVAEDRRRLCAEAMRTIPVSVGTLCTNLGLKVVSSTLPPGVSGEIRPDLTSAATSFVIKVNRHEAKVRQRFTVAHEIGHFLLHEDLISDGVVDSVMYRSRSLSGGQEAQANRVAADILMPRYTIKSYLEKNSINVIDENTAPYLAKYLRVSLEAVRIRFNLDA